MKFAALMYHNLAKEPANEYAITPEALRWQLAWLRDSGFTAEGFDGLERRLKDNGPWPESYALLTFDDGHRSNLQAAEILAEHGLKATFFLTRDASREADFLDENEIRQLAATMDVGSHGLTHRSWLKMGRKAAEAELVDSKAWLEDVVGRPVTSCSAPGGDIDRFLCRRALEFGYRLVGTSEEWWNDMPSLHRSGTVRRLMVFRNYGPDQFGALARLSAPFYYRRRARYASTTLAKRILPESWIPAAARLKRRLIGH